MPGNPLSADLDRILQRTGPLWEELRGQRIFVTGGTGFFGCWLLESFAWSNEKLGLGAEMLVLTRDVERFRRKAPHLAARPDLKFHVGDLKNFKFPAGAFSHVLHLGTEPVTGPDGAGDIEAGTRHALEFTARCGAKKFLFTSSGAVYGRQPPETTHLAEDDPPKPDTPYGEGKWRSERLCIAEGARHGIEIKISRGFAFVGPYLPLDSNFAIGNFIGDALAGRPIKVNGDGTPFRSYLYAADLAAWLWTILFKGVSNRPYNVGSSQTLTIAETAAAVARAFDGKPSVTIARKPSPDQPAQRYVPNINRAVSELQLDQWTPLDDAIRATARWRQPA